MRYNDHFKSNSISCECNCLRSDGYGSPTKCQHILYRDIKHQQHLAINGATASVKNEAASKLREKSFHYGHEKLLTGLILVETFTEFTLLALHACYIPGCSIQYNGTCFKYWDYLQHDHELFCPMLLVLTAIHLTLLLHAFILLFFPQHKIFSGQKTFLNSNPRAAGILIIYEI